jgi:hypothetical protein
VRRADGARYLAAAVAGGAAAGGVHVTVAPVTGFA